MWIYLRVDICADLFEGEIFEQIYLREIFMQVYLRGNICSVVFQGKYFSRYI